MKKSVKIIIVIAVVLFLGIPLVIALIGSFMVPKLLSNMSSKACCMEIGGTVSGNVCVFDDLDGTELMIELNKLEDSNGKNYCTDEYFDRDDSVG